MAVITIEVDTKNKDEDSGIPAVMVIIMIACGALALCGLLNYIVVCKNRNNNEVLKYQPDPEKIQPDLEKAVEKGIIAEGKVVKKHKPK